MFYFLPKNIWIEIFYYCDLESIFKISIINSKFKKFVNNNIVIWQDFGERYKFKNISSQNDFIDQFKKKL